MRNDFPNIINQDGQAIYFGCILNEEQIIHFYTELFNNIDWRNEEVMMFGKTITTKRKVAFYADAGISYTYSGRSKQGLAWTEALLILKKSIENITSANYNACLLNLYHDGSESMGWHSDAEKEIVPNSSIASLSLGAERKFSFKHKTSNEKVDVLLENGSLLVMKGPIQNHWLHAMPKTSKVFNPRINLTFRKMIP